MATGTDDPNPIGQIRPRPILRDVERSIVFEADLDDGATLVSNASALNANTDGLTGYRRQDVPCKPIPNELATIPTIVTTRTGPTGDQLSSALRERSCP